MKVAQLREQAVEALRGGDVQLAIELLDEATRLQPDNVQLYHELAECQWANYDFDKALQSYENAYRVGSAIVASCTLAAKRLFGLARFHESARWLVRAKASAPQDEGLLTMLGE